MEDWILYLHEVLSCPGGIQIYILVGVCQKEGLGSRFYLKMRGLGNENLENLHLQSLNFGQNKAKNAKFF